MKRFPAKLFVLPAILLALGCGARSSDVPESRRLRATRGFVLISVDTLRADALGAYGSKRATTPFLDKLAAERATLFENAFTAIPSTLPSHMSMFTGLYPSEHGVTPPSGVLATSIPTLPMLMKQAGFHTFGHSEGAFVKGTYGFARGFDSWTDTTYSADTDIERTFGRGIAELEKVAPGERFFLFLHTYSVHDPYEPPDRYRDLFWKGAAPAGAFAPTGRNFVAFNKRPSDGPPEAAAYYRALYDAGVRYVDDTVVHLFAELDRRGLTDDTTVIFTADHGEEFLEHGNYVHSQAYPECLRIPLLVVHPDLKRGRRVSHLAQTVDLLPTLADLAGFAPPPGLSGHSLVPLLGDGADAGLAGRAYAQVESHAFRVRSVLMPVSSHLYQLLFYSYARLEPDGFWMARKAVFDATPVSGAFEFRAVAFRYPRRATVYADGNEVARLEIDTQWKTYRVELPAERRVTITIQTPRCTAPKSRGAGSDERCISIKLDGVPLQHAELFDLSTDPGAHKDLSLDQPDLVRTLFAELRKYPERARAAAGSTDLTDEQVRNLKALGYLQ